MRAALALGLAFAFAAAVPAVAQTPTGVSGYIINVDTHRPLDGAEVSIYRMPVESLTGPISVLHTDKHGYFSNIRLAPGHYIIMASALNDRAGCEISDLYDGAISRVRILVSSKGEHCEGKNVRTALVMPGQTSSVYIIH